MLRRTTIVVCVSFLMFSVAAIGSATSYTFTTLNPAGSDTTACGLALALVGGVPTAGGVTNGSAAGLNSGYPCIWNSAGTATNILSKIPGSPTRGHVFAMDSSGDVVGSEKMGSVQNPFFLASGSTLGATLPMLNTGDTYNAAYGMQGSSTVVGIDGPAYTSTQGAVWTKTGSTWGSAALPGLPGGAAGMYTGAYAISSAGIAGSALTSGGTEDAVTWTLSGLTWTINDLVNHSDPQNATGRSRALAINSSGAVVGWSMLANFPDTGQHAAYFSGGDAVNLALPYTGSAARVDSANGINDNGVIVGTSLTGNNTASAYDAFIYDATNGVRDMNAVFAGIIPNGWTLTTATGIDSNGDIVGYMTNNGGSNNEGFLITASVPEPSALLLAATGLVGLLAYAWRKRKW